MSSYVCVPHRTKNGVSRQYGPRCSSDYEEEESAERVLPIPASLAPHKDSAKRAICSFSSSQEECRDDWFVAHTLSQWKTMITRDARETASQRPRER